MKRIGLIMLGLMLGGAGFGRAETALTQLRQLASERVSSDATVPDVAAVPLANGLSETYVGERKTETITRHAGENKFSAPMEVKIYRVWTDLIPQSVEYVELVCATPPVGDNGNWYGFYDADVPPSEKAKRLADAIAGIDPVTAQCVVDSLAFQLRPRSWPEFKSCMKSADSKCKNGIYYRAIAQYGRTNTKNLGYADAVNCRKEKQRERMSVPIERKTYSRTAKADVSLEIKNAPLLPSESETFQLIFDGFKAVVQPNSRYSDYRIKKSGDFDFVLTGRRKLVTPNNSLAVEVLPTSSADVLLRITDLDYQPEVDITQVQTCAILSVMRPRDLFWDSEIVKIRIPLVNGKTEVTLNQYVGFELPRGKTYYVKYSLTRRNSRLNNISESLTLETAQLTR